MFDRRIANLASGKNPSIRNDKRANGKVRKKMPTAGLSAPPSVLPEAGTDRPTPPPTSYMGGLEPTLDRMRENVPSGGLREQRDRVRQGSHRPVGTQSDSLTRYAEMQRSRSMKNSRK